MADQMTDITDEEIDALLAEVTEEIDDGKKEHTGIQRTTTTEITSPKLDVNKPSGASVSSGSIFTSSDAPKITASEFDIEKNANITKANDRSPSISPSVIGQKPAEINLPKTTAVVDTLASAKSDPPTASASQIKIETKADATKASTELPAIPTSIQKEEPAAVNLPKSSGNADILVATNDPPKASASETRIEKNADVTKANTELPDKGVVLDESRKGDALTNVGDSTATDVKTGLKKKTSSTSSNKTRPGAAVPAPLPSADLEKKSSPTVTSDVSIVPASTDPLTAASSVISSSDVVPASASKSANLKDMPTSPRKASKFVAPKATSSEEMLAAADGILRDKKIQDSDPLKKGNSEAMAASDKLKTLHRVEKSGASVSRNAQSEVDVNKLTKSVSADPVSQSTATPSTSSWGWSSFRSFGSTVLSSASSITTQVGGSMYQVLEAVESSLVEPEVVIPPEKMRLRNKQRRVSSEEKSIDADDLGNGETPRVVTALVVSSIDRAGSQDDGNASGVVKDSGSAVNPESAGVSDAGWFGGWGLKDISGAVHKSGKKVVGSGLHVLETISKKTLSIWNTGMEDEVVQAGGAGTKSLLMKRFDDCLGVVHFDALKTLSTMSREKLPTQLDVLSADSLHSLNADLAIITDAFYLGEMGWELQLSEVDHEFQRLINDYVTRLGLSIRADKLITLHESIVNWLESCRKEDQDGRNCPPEEVHQMAVMMLAELTANSVALFHKIAQLILVDTCTPALSYKFRSLCLAGLTKVICTEVWIQMRHFTEHINKSEKAESKQEAMALIQDLTVEASNCSTCLQDAFQLIQPIMHLALTRVHPLCLDNSGIPHLEGLQIISRMSALSVRGSTGQLDETVQRRVLDIESKFDLSHLLSVQGHEDIDKAIEQDFRTIISKSLSQLDVEKSVDQIVNSQARIRQWLTESVQDNTSEVKTSSSDIHQRAIQSLTEFKSSVIEIYHNVAESLLSDKQPDEDNKTTRQIDYHEKADALTSVTRIFCREVGVLSTRFTSCLTASVQSNDSSTASLATGEASATPFITNIYLEASNSMTCIQDGYQLLLPILQLAVIKQYKSSVAGSREAVAEK